MRKGVPAKDAFVGQKHNITAEQYHSLNVIQRIKLRDFLIRSLAKPLFVFADYFFLETSTITATTTITAAPMIT